MLKGWVAYLEDPIAFPCMSKQQVQTLIFRASNSSLWLACFNWPATTLFILNILVICAVLLKCVAALNPFLLC